MKEIVFWNWFKDHQSEYLHLNDLDKHRKEFLLNQFLKQLHKYCNKLYFQIGGNPSKERRELVITAEGNVDYFDAVEKLVNAAPKINNWQVIPFKQPMGIDFVTDYEGLKLDPQTMWFLPLINEKNLSMVGLRICIDNYDAEDANRYKRGVYQVLDTILGEKVVGTKIDYFDIDILSSYNPEKDGLFKLVDLQQYITRKKLKP